MTTQDPHAQCPLCAAEVTLTTNIEIGEFLDCGECGEELEVLSLSPPTLSEALEEEEDWEE